MIGERDIWRAAMAMVRRYGTYARIEAATKVLAMYDDGDKGATATWLRVLKAVDMLQAKEPAAGEWVQ